MRGPKDWKELLTQEQKAQVDDAIASKIEKVISRSSHFWKAPEAWQKSVLAKLVRLFRWRDEDGYQVPADKVFVLSTETDLVVSLHYHVYLRLAEKAGVELIAFEILEDRKGERLRLVGPNGREREFCVLYEHFDSLKEKKKSWQDHFYIMIKKTMFRQALAYFFPLLIENSAFAEIAHFDEDELIINGNGHTENGVVNTEAPEKERLIERLCFLAEKINGDAAARIYLRDAVKEAGIKLYGEGVDNLFKESVKRLMMSQLSVDALKELCGVADAIYEFVDDKSTRLMDILQLRSELLEEMKNLTDAKKKQKIREIMAEGGYGTLTEIGRLSVLLKLRNLLHYGYELTEEEDWPL
jgi:hypothetical protein